MKKSSNKGFTLVELIIVIAILAIIMLIAIPNFSGIQQRMQVRADKATAAQIGKAVRVWFTDYTTDAGLVKAAAKEPTAATPGSVAPEAYTAVTANGENHSFTALPVGAAAATSYENLVHIDEYISKGQKPTSLKTSNVTDENQFYGVVLTQAATNSAAKIAIVITNPSTTVDVSSVTEASYDGSTPGVAYIEP